MSAASQKDRVLADLRRALRRGVCAERWYAGGIPNARNRISELRGEGWCIASFPCPDEHGPGYFKYALLHGRGRTCNVCRAEIQPRLIA